MRIKINDKIYRLKETESGVDSLMELVEEPQYKDGDFVVNMNGSVLIFKEKVGDRICDYALFNNISGLNILPTITSSSPIKRHADEWEKDRLIYALAKEGKRWNAEKKCVEDIPKLKFKKGDKVRIKEGVSSKTHESVFPFFNPPMDDSIGVTMTVDGYPYGGACVICNESDWWFLEEWLEPYVEDTSKPKFKIGDKVRIKDGISSDTHLDMQPCFTAEMDELIGKELTVDGCSNGRVFTKESGYHFHEEWLEPYEELKEGDLAIFWDFNKRVAIIGEYNRFHEGSCYPHIDNRGDVWANAIGFESKEQFKRFIKGEI